MPERTNTPGTNGYAWVKDEYRVWGLYETQEEALEAHAGSDGYLAFVSLPAEREEEKEEEQPMASVEPIRSSDPIQALIDRGLRSNRKNIINHAESIERELERLKDRLEAEDEIISLNAELAEARKRVRRNTQS